MFDSPGSRKGARAEAMNAAGGERMWLLALFVSTVSGRFTEASSCVLISRVRVKKCSGVLATFPVWSPQTTQGSVRPTSGFVSCLLSHPGAGQVGSSPDLDATLVLTSPEVKGCVGCTGAERSQLCTSPLLLNVSTLVSLDFKCPRPQDVFHVEIVQSVGKFPFLLLSPHYSNYEKHAL